MGFLDEDTEVNEMSCDDIDKVLEANRLEGNKILEGEEPMAEVNERVERASEALKDAKKAYELAGVPAQSEDIRSLAITFMIDEGKNGRMTTVRKEREVMQQPVESAKPIVQQAQSGVVCALCGSGTYDNSQNKRNPKAPDYKCKSCEAVAWKSNTNKFFPAKKYN